MRSVVPPKPPISELKEAEEFLQQLGEGHILSEDTAIDHLFYKVLDPAVCIYECEVRAFREDRHHRWRSRRSDVNRGVACTEKESKTGSGESSRRVSNR